MWVRSEYVGEFAVLSTWLCALLPWSVSYGARGAGHQIRVHFTYLFVQFTPGLSFEGFLALVHEAAAVAADPSTATGYDYWLLGSAVFVLPLAASVAYYVYDERLEARAPVDPARLIGALLMISGLPFTAATYYVHSGFPGVTIPLGVVFMYVFGGMLLIADRT